MGTFHPFQFSMLVQMGWKDSLGQGYVSVACHQDPSTLGMNLGIGFLNNTT
jgi:hypothetical protein